MINETTTFKEFLGGPPGDFNPVAHYDKHMDCIRVELRDCSTTEVRVTPMLTLLHDNHPSAQQSRLAGITIKGVRHLFKKWGIPLSGVMQVTTIIGRLLQELPADPENLEQEKKEVQIVNHIASEIELRIDLNVEPYALAH